MVQTQILVRQAELLQRIRRGNEVLWDALDTVPLPKWREARARLIALVDELADTGHNDCAYDPKLNPPAHTCFACTRSNESWTKENCPAWKLDEERLECERKVNRV